MEEQGKCRCLKSAYVFCWNDKDNHFPPIRIFFLLGTCLFFVIDVGLDIWVAYEHYVADRDGTDEYASYYLYSTLFFIIVPQIVINLISWLLYTWGFIVFNSKQIRNYYRRQLEDLKYVEYDEAGNRRKDSLHIEGKQVISWPWYGKSKQRRMKSIHQSVASDSTSPKSSSPPAPFDSPQDLLISSAGPGSPDYQQETTFSGGDLWDKQSTASTSHTTKVKVYRHFSHKRTESETPILEETDTHLEFYPLDLFDICEYILVTLLHILLLGFIFRVVRLVYKRKNDKYSFDRYRDVSFLRLMESFLEAAPQLVLQLYIVIVREERRLSYNIITPISIIVSVCSLALSVADYISAVKDLYYYDPPPHRERKPRLTWTGYFLVIFWHLCMIVGRGITFTLFASIFGGYLFLVVGVHYVAMVYWMYWQQANVLIHSSEDYDARSRNGRRVSTTTTTDGRRSIRSCLDPRNHICGNYGIEFIIAAFNIFFHFKLKEGGSVETLVPFYVLSFVENVLMIFLWYYARDFSIYTWYAIPAVVTVFVTFALGLLFLSIYYYKFQPHKQSNLEPDPYLNHPTMTSTMSRMYLQKQVKGNFIQRLFNLARGGRRQSSDAEELEAVDITHCIPAQH